MTKLKIMTLGSCFAGSVANCLWRVSPETYQRVCSIQHTRVDQLVDAHIRCDVSPVRKAETGLVLKPAFENVLDNQCDDILFGRSLPYGMERSDLMHPRDAIESGVDVLLVDSFADLLFRVYRNPLTNQKIYFHKDQLISNSGLFNDALDRLSPAAAIDGYLELFSAVRAHRPNACLIFLGFPVSDSKRVEIVSRTKEFQEAAQRFWDVPGAGVVDLINLPVDDLTLETDPYHFVWPRYLQYSFMVDGLVRVLGRCPNRSFREHAPNLLRARSPLAPIQT